MEIVYEVRTRFASPELRERYLRWLHDGHLDAVIDAGALEGEARASDEGVISRYRFASRAAFEAYQQGPAVALRAESKALFSEGVTMERSIEEVQLRRLRAPLEVVPVPCLSDNYAYLLIDRDTATAIVVDPSEAGPVERALIEEGVALVGIWCTHHHFDHVGGNVDLSAAHPGIAVLGSAHDAQAQQIPGLTRAFGDGEEVLFGARSFSVMSIPGHTLGAVAYVGEGLAFTGDTLFSGGCGRVFEGTMSMMRGSMQKLMGLPPSTRIYSGHEYTVKNLEFAKAVEPGAEAIEARLSASRAQREHGEPTVGAPLADELATNPFLRWDSPSVIAYAQKRGDAGDPDEVFARIREAKNSF
jgi:hydroxyacylglutathione hydrolase